MTVSPRCKVSAFVVLSLLPLALTVRANDQTAPASQPLLQPFMPAAAKPADPKAARALAGVWKGTFKHKNDDGTGSESTYLVEVGPGLTTLKVSLVQPNPAPAIGQTDATELLLQPTLEAQPVVWDGTTLQAHSREEHLLVGKATLTVDKTLGLRLERDSRHALFTYNVRVKSVSGPSTVTNTRQGTGILTRPR